jgi:site-specific DNA-methyltransferase (adenine-specific)
MKEINTVHNGDWLNNQLPDKSVQLIIADPPYFEVKGDFDFVWKSFDDYLKDVEKWAIECKRLLADNGTLFWYGHAKKIAYAQIIFDKYFNLENNIAIEFNRQTKKGVENFRCFAPVSERLLMYSNESESTNLENALYAESVKVFTPIIEYMKEQKRMIKEYFEMKTDNEFNEYINKLTNTKSVVSRHYFTYSQWVFPTAEIYAKLQTINNEVFKKEYEVFKKEYEVFKKEYEVFKKEYEELRRPFNNFMKLFDIMSFDQEAHITGKYDHDTCKPETLTRALILTCSRPNDLILVPFAGSGTECAMAVKENRNFIGFDIEEKYVKMANKRVNLIKQAPQLF